jgi:hypothetical protein
MWQKIAAKAQELIKLAEGMKDLNGAEKKAYVVKMMCGAIDLPLVPEWIEGLFEPALYGFVVDTAVRLWNEATGHRLEKIPDSDPDAADAMAEAVQAELAVAALGKPAAGAPEISAKFDALLAKYSRK